MQHALIKGLYEIGQPQLSGIIKGKKIALNPDILIEQLLSKQYDNQNIVDILKHHAITNEDQAFCMNATRGENEVGSILNSRQSSYQNLSHFSEVKQRPKMQTNKVRYTYLNSRSK